MQYGDELLLYISFCKNFVVRYFYTDKRNENITFGIPSIFADKVEMHEELKINVYYILYIIFFFFVYRSIVYG